MWHDYKQISFIACQLSISHSESRSEDAWLESVSALFKNANNNRAEWVTVCWRQTKRCKNTCLGCNFVFILPQHTPNPTHVSALSSYTYPLQTAQCPFPVLMAQGNGTHLLFRTYVGIYLLHLSKKKKKKK